MSIYPRGTDKRRILQEYDARDEEIAVVFGRQLSPKMHVEQEKKIRREIANSNERRRMQSINAGFQSLRALIPHHEGEKLSKAAILQQTAEYIHNLEQEKTKLLAQNSNLKQLLNELNCQRGADIDYGSDISLYGSSPPSKRKKRDTESSDEGITADYEDYSVEEVRREMIQLRQQLDRERQLRMALESKAQMQECPMYPTERSELIPRNETLKQETELVYMDTMKQEVHEAHSEEDHQLPPSPPPPKSENVVEVGLHSSMSRRNLETIVEAIRHLEGEQRLHPELGHSEESEKDSSVTSDQDDVVSDNSGRDSPMSIHYVHSYSAQPKNSFHEKYPIAANLLHGPLQSQIYYRPGVIVQKS